MSNVRENYKEMVIYLLKGDYIDDSDVIEGYTDSLYAPYEQLRKGLAEQRLAKEGLADEIRLLRKKLEIAKSHLTITGLHAYNTNQTER